MKVAIIWDEKATNNHGGTFTSGAWRERTLNTKLDPNDLVALSSNQVTIIAAGNYLIRAHAPAGYGTYYHQVRLLKNGTQLALGTNEDALPTHSITRSFVSYVGSFAANDIIKLEHRCYSTVATYGMGIVNSWGTEIYAVMEVYQL